MYSMLDEKCEQLVHSVRLFKSSHLWIMNTLKCVTWEIRMTMASGAFADVVVIKSSMYSVHLQKSTSELFLS